MNIKSNWILLSLVLLAGCSTPNQPEVGMGEVPIPKRYHPDLIYMDMGPSDHERYLDAYERGYWDCIIRYCKDINYVPKDSDSYGNGWGSEVEGYGDGYTAAEKDMARNFRRFGRVRTAQYLEKVWEGP